MINVVKNPKEAIPIVISAFLKEDEKKSSFKYNAKKRVPRSIPGIRCNKPAKIPK